MVPGHGGATDDRAGRRRRAIARRARGSGVAARALAAVLALLAVALSGPSAAHAQVTALANPAPGVQPYWTAARMATAQPLPLRVAALPVAPVPRPAAVAPLWAAAAPPTRSARPASRQALFDPVLRVFAPSQQPLMGDPSLGVRFTSARMTPDAAAALGAEALFPTALNGQLFFKVPSGTTVPAGHYVCSATVQRARIIVTAGHCVSDGSGHLFKKFLFVPALRDGAGPFGSWSWVFVTVSDAWHFGGGEVPNEQDVAAIELADVEGVRIGDLTGTAGYLVPGLGAKQHVTINGYACNIDACNKMHRNDGQASAALKNTAVVGSDMRGGASGGGWLLNWGEYGVGQPSAGVADPAALLLVGVTSYGPTGTSLFYLGASVLDGRYVNGVDGVLDRACAHRPGNC